MNKSDYTPIAMRGGIGDILLYSIKIWGNGFWKTFLISFFVIIPLLISIILFNTFIPILTETNQSETTISNTEKDIISDESESYQIISPRNISIISYILISVVVIFSFFCLSMGANIYISGRLSVGENPSIADALSFSFQRLGSYFIYTIAFSIISLIFLVIVVPMIGVEGMSEYIGWIVLCVGIALIFLSPILLLVFPAMIYMKTNIFKALKGVISLLKRFYGRAFGLIVICIVIIFIFLNFTLQNFSSISLSISNIRFDNLSFGFLVNFIIWIILLGFLYGIITTILSLTFLNVWSCKLGLDNIYAIKILSSALNKRKIPKNWYRNKEAEKIEGKKSSS